MLFLLLTGFATALTLASVQQFVIAVPISPIPTIPPAIPPKLVDEGEAAYTSPNAAQLAITT